jgi:hypothetical protein
MIDKRYKLNLAAGLISIISQVSHGINHLACRTTKSMYLHTVGFRHEVAGSHFFILFLLIAL